jgi:dipeptidyl aminopeptidase/acylaminoacyl peptidase
MFVNSDEEKRKRSVLYWAEKLPKNIPLLIMHGTSDWRVNPLDSIRLAEKLQTNKVPYRLIMYEGADHGITEFRKEASDEMFRWFDRYVKNKAPLPNLKLHGE